MTDYIKREDVYDQLDRWARDLNNPQVYQRDDARCVIDGIPSADVVPVVRCKDCKCWTEWANGTGSCNRFTLVWVGMDADDFCSMGERKDDE